MYRNSGALVQTFAAIDKQQMVTPSVLPVHKVSRNVLNNMKPLGTSCKFTYIFVQFFKMTAVFRQIFVNIRRTNCEKNQSNVSHADT